MTCLSKSTVTGIGLLVPAVLALALSVPAYAGPPVCDSAPCNAPGSAFVEGEACIANNGEDLFNSGCNAVAPSIADFTVIGIGTGPLANSFIVCGNTSTFQNGDPCVDDADCVVPETCDVDAGLCDPSDSRDTDWYVVPQALLAAFDTDNDGRILISTRLRSGFDGTIFLVAIDGGGVFCANTTLDFTNSTAPELGGCSEDSQDIQAVIVLADHPSGISIVVVNQTFGTGTACGAGNNGYLIQVWGNDVVAACDAGAGPCNEPNATPGCEDAECCSLVCLDLPLCCLLPWDVTCVNQAISSIGCAFTPYSCDAPDLTQPDCCDVLSASPPLIIFDDDVFAFDTTDANSDGPPEGTGADCIPNTLTLVGNDLWFIFEATENGTLTASTCDTATFDTILEVYDIGPVGSAFDCDDIKAQIGQIGCNDTGGQGGEGQCSNGPEAEDTAHVHVDVVSGIQYLVRLGGFQVGGGNPAAEDWGPGTISFDFIPGEALFNTGPHETVLFNGAASLLGWISGQIAPGPGLDTDRRCVQAFTLPELPPGPNTVWKINEIYFGAFQSGTNNELMNIEIFSRTPGPDPPNDAAWPGKEPVPADSLVLITMPIPIAVEYPDRPIGNDDNYAANLTDQNLLLPPGDYWLTQFASNTAKTFESSSLAWLTNAHGGINNFCDVDSPADYPDGTNLGCTGVAPLHAVMYRARIYPPEIDPDAGYRSYVLTKAVLDIDPANDPTPDAADLYNASFQIRGIPATEALPCPWDCGGDNDGNVGIVDFLALLGTWTTVGAPCDFDNDGVGIVDFLALLGNWGDCPQ